jgi:hypothetical protein
MGKINRISASVAPPVKQAQLVDPSGFSFGTSQQQAFRQITGAVAGVEAEGKKMSAEAKKADEAERKVQAELQRRRALAQNSISATEVASSRRVARDKAKLFMLEHPNPDEWQIGINDIITEQSAVKSTLPMSPEEFAKQTADDEAFRRELMTETELVGTQVTIDKDIATKGAQFISEVADGSVSIDTMREYSEAVHRKHTPEEAKILIEETIKQGKEQRREDAKSEIEEQAALTPVAVTEQMNEELAARKKGKGDEGLAELSNTDLESIRDYAKTVGVKKVDQSANLADQLVTDNYVKIADGDVDINSMIADINADVAITAGDKVTAIEKTRTFFSGWHSTEMANKAWPLVDDDTSLTQLNTDLTAQSSGSLDINEVNEKINLAANSGKLTRATRDSLRAKSAKGGNDAIDKAVELFTTRVRNVLTVRFSDIVARAKVREVSRDLTTEERREAASAGFLLQVGFEQLNSYKRDLDTALREVKGGRETVSGVEADAMAMSVWEKYKIKTDAQRIRDYQEFTGARAPRPEGFNKDIWDTSTPDVRAKIVTAASRGMNLKDLEAMHAE